MKKNLFRVNKVGKITHLVKDNGDEVFIFVGDENSPTELISNNSFGESISKRGISLIYFNTSCWSKNKAIFEIQASGSKLIDICSKTPVTFFRDNDATSQMIDQFLDRKSYGDMREAMKKDSRYEKKTVNYFIFPDTDEYKNDVLSAIRFQIKVDYTLINPEGKETNIDELDQH